MSRLIWKEEYSVGDVEIDKQHQGLFALIDRLEDQDVDQSAMAVTFEKLDNYVCEHFTAEENLLRICNYEDLESHLRQHDEFRNWLKTVKESFRSDGDNKKAIGQNLQVFLRDWLLSHIMHSDQAYKDWIK